MLAPLPPEIERQIVAWAPLPGWAPQNKMRDMAALILRWKPAVVVELGVYGGRSMLPQAAAVAANGAGRVYAVDPYSLEAVREGTEAHDKQTKYWETVDLGQIEAGAHAATEAAGLAPVVEWVRAPAHVAARRFAPRSVDVLHVDGNHSEAAALRDVETYWPLLAAGAAVWMDDTNWDSLRAAVRFVDARADLVHDYGAFRLYRANNHA